MILRDIPFTIPKKDVLFNLKFNVRNSKMTPSVESLIVEMINEGYILSEPKAVKDDFKIAECDRNVTRLGDSFAIESESISELLRPCYKATLFICTIGDAIPKAVAKFISEGEITKGAVLDSVASEAVEAVANKVNEIIAQEAIGELAYLTRRYSPGYGDWDLRYNKDILDILKGGEIGVSITENFLMQPEKSITAIVGWIKK